jgi:hypothetical protein
MRTCFHGLVLVLFLGLGALIAIPTGAAAPIEAKKIDKLIEKLGGDDFNDREKASAELDAIGAPALEALRKATKSKDVEISKRAADLIAKIEKRTEAAKILAPKKIHLLYRDTPVANALADFSKKSGYQIALLDPENKVKDRKMSLDTGDVTFWQAFELFCKEAGLAEMDIQGFANPGVRPVPIRPGLPNKRIEIQPLPLPPQKEGKEPAKKDEGQDGRVAPQPGKGFGVPQQGQALPGAAPVQVIGAPVPPGPGGIGIGPGGIGIGAGVGWGFNGGFGNQIIVTDGKPKALPTDNSGAIRVRAMEKPEIFGPADEKLILLGLELTPEPKMQVMQIVTVKVDKALDDQDQNLVQSTVAPANVPGVLPGAGPAIGRGAIVAIGFNNLTPVYLKKAEKPSKSLKEFTGVVSAQVLAPATPYITADKIMAAAGKEFKGEQGGRIKVIDVSKAPNGQITVRFELEQPPNLFPANPFVPNGPFGAPGIQINPNPIKLPQGALPLPPAPPAAKPGPDFRAAPPQALPPQALPPQAVPVQPAQIAPAQVQIQIAPAPANGPFAAPAFFPNQNGVTLEDEKGNVIQAIGVNANFRRDAKRGAVLEHIMIFQPEKDQKPAKLVFSASKTVAIDIPFTLKNVTLP